MFDWMIVDMSSVCWTGLLVGEDKEFGRKVEFEGKVRSVNSAKFGYENAMNHLVSSMKAVNLTPKQVVLVVEGKDSKLLRRAVLDTYKAKRDARPPEAYEEFNALKQMLVDAFLDCGATAVTQDGLEADDVIAYLSSTLRGRKVVLSADGDLAVLVNKGTSLLRNGELDGNPYGPFDNRFITLYKALVGDSSDNIPGARGFGPKAFLDLVAVFGDEGLEEMENLVRQRRLDALVEDVGELRALQKVMDSAEMVYRSWDCASLYPERVSPRLFPRSNAAPVQDERIGRWFGAKRQSLDLDFDRAPAPSHRRSRHVVFDTELIGTDAPVFLCCTECVETGERHAFWHHREGDMARMAEHFAQPDTTFVSFNGIKFDVPILGAAVAGQDAWTLKRLANQLVSEQIRHWDAHKPENYDFKPLSFDHIDLYEVAPGPMISMKTYAGRLGYPTMQDLPFEHDLDLDETQCEVVEQYCYNDLGITRKLFDTLQRELATRVEMSEQYGVDLRSKSDAQVAEAVLRKVCGITGRDKVVPTFVRYKAPDFIKTDSPVILDLIAKLEGCEFKIHPGNGAVEAPDFLKDPIKIGWGTYQFGVGGLHSTMDSKLHIFADDNLMLSDFDVASYYPNIMLKAGLIPKLEGDKGSVFIDAYRDIYNRRIEAKRLGNKSVANTLKIVLNGTFGKLGSLYASFYSPDLMLAVTVTGQLNLACLIHELEKNPGVTVQSANTDGICVMYPPKMREQVLETIQRNAIQTGFEYEETPYQTIAFKDVNNYIAITADAEATVINSESIKRYGAKGGKAKRKGLYASNDPKENPLFLMKNPTMEVCSNLAVDYLRNGTHPRDGIAAYTDIRDFVAIRNVKGGGIQYDTYVEVDDWVLVHDVGTKDNLWARQKHLDNGDGSRVRRKSRPNPVRVGVGGTPFGRVARWYMTREALPPISYVASGNTVPKTDGARVLMTLPSELPNDIDLDWYVNEALRILCDIGVELPEDSLEN